MKQPRLFKFKLELKNGNVIEGGAETKELCLDHIRHVLHADEGAGGESVIAGWYMGKNGTAEPRQITLS